MVIISIINSIIESVINSVISDDGILPQIPNGSVFLLNDDAYLINNMFGEM